MPLCKAREICCAYFRFVGINASDINYTAGRYDPKLRPPFDVGFEVRELLSSGANTSVYPVVKGPVQYFKCRNLFSYKLILQGSPH